MLKDEARSVRKFAAGALGSIGDVRAVEPLIAMLKDDEDYVACVYAAGALGSIGDTRAVEPLITMLKNEHPSMRGHAAEALGKIGDPRAVEPLIALEKDEIEAVRSDASKALEECRKGVSRPAHRTVGELLAITAVEAQADLMGEPGWAYL